MNYELMEQQLKSDQQGNHDPIIDSLLKINSDFKLGLNEEDLKVILDDTTTWVSNNQEENVTNTEIDESPVLWFKINELF